VKKYLTQMDLMRFRNEMCPRYDQKTILEDYIKEIINSPNDTRSLKFCEILVNNLYAHGNTYNNHLQMQKLVMLKMKGILEDF
jgi:phage portal protein BeeE